MLLDTNVLILYISGSLEKSILDKVNYEIVLKNAYINQIIIAEVLAYNLYSDKQAKEIEMFIYKKFLSFDKEDFSNIENLEIFS
jgi:predicted nucleic acid-binding protein